MALSMLVLIVPVFLLVGLFRFLGHETPPSVDASEAYGSAQRAGQFQPLRADLPDGWRISSATFTDGVLRLGVTGPDDVAVQIVESARTDLGPAVIGPSPKDDGETTIQGASWHRYTQGRAGERALVQTTPPRTVIIVGQGTAGQLAELAATLRA
jgi:hypothetical protein